MNEVSIISYKLQRCNEGQKTAIKRAICGYNDHSNKGLHVYKRTGLLHKIPHKKIAKSVIMINKSDKNKLVKIFRNNKASISIIELYSKKAIQYS
jgi:hypothetical protein